MKDYFVKEAYGLERIHHVMATSKEEAISIDNDVTSQIFTDVEELPIEEDNNIEVETNEESKEENTTE